MVYQDHLVSTILNDLPSQLADLASAQDRPHFTSELSGDLGALAQQLQANLGNMAVFLLNKNPNIMFNGHISPHPTIYS